MTARYVIHDFMPVSYGVRICTNIIIESDSDDTIGGIGIIEIRNGEKERIHQSGDAVPFRTAFRYFILRYEPGCNAISSIIIRGHGIAVTSSELSQGSDGDKV